MAETPSMKQTSDGQPWGTYYANDQSEVHVIPCNPEGEPILPHFPSPSCVCDPSNSSDSPWVWTHHVIVDDAPHPVEPPPTPYH
jgi:hypothetical protein